MAADLHLLTNSSVSITGQFVLVHEVLCVILSVINWHRGYFSVILTIVMS